jgi:hypothetical protein
MILVSLHSLFTTPLDVRNKSQKEGVSHEDRKAAWNDDQVSYKRDDLRARIMNLSCEWKKQQAGKEEIVSPHLQTLNNGNDAVLRDF